MNAFAFIVSALEVLTSNEAAVGVTLVTHGHHMTGY
jgi:hypothetical protein